MRAPSPRETFFQRPALRDEMANSYRKWDGRWIHSVARLQPPWYLVLLADVNLLGRLAAIVAKQVLLGLRRWGIPLRRLQMTPGSLEDVDRTWGWCRHLLKSFNHEKTCSPGGISLCGLCILGCILCQWQINFDLVAKSQVMLVVFLVLSLDPLLLQFPKVKYFDNCWCKKIIKKIG